MYRASPADGIAWIAGASSGIGRAVALELARRGYRVAVTARRADALEALSAEAAAAGLRIDAFAGDVTDRDAMAALLERIEREAGPVALAMLNAGNFYRDPEGVWGGDGFRRTMALNFDGVLNGLEPLIPRMKGRGRGQIAVVASVAGYGGLPGAAAYCASKAALIAACESMHPQLTRDAIHLQVICPGFVRTPLTEKNKTPMPFIMPAEEAARRICAGFERNGFEIAFPRRLVWLLKALNMLPYPAYFWIVGRRGAR